MFGRMLLFIGSFLLWIIQKTEEVKKEEMEEVFYPQIKELSASWKSIWSADTRIICRFKKYLWPKEIIYWICGVWLGPNFVVQLTADKDFYCWLTVEKMHAFAVFNNKYLRSYDCNDTNFRAAVNYTNPKTQIVSDIIEIRTIRTPTVFLFLC